MLTFTRRRPPAATPTLDEMFDRRGYYRSPVTLASYHVGKEPPNKGRKFPPEVLTAAECYALLDACGRSYAGRRNRAIIIVGWRAGLRCAEALALRPKDVDLDRGRIQVLHGKGDKRRVVAIDPAAGAIIDRWLIERRKLGVSGAQPLFCVISKPTIGQPMHAAYVRDLMKVLARKAGIEKRVHYHGLRHTYAAHLMDSGVPIHYIRRMLGHSSIAITERYADHINPAQVVEALRALDWPEPASASRRAGAAARAPAPSSSGERAPAASVWR